MSELLQQFLVESRDFIESISTCLLALERSPGDSALMDELFRHVHTLKGNCGLFDFPDMFRVIHAAEDLMSAVRNSEVAYSQQLADVLLDAMDFVTVQLDAIDADGEPGTGGQAQATMLAQQLRAHAGAGGEQAAAPLAADAPAETPAAVIEALALMPAEQQERCRRAAGAGEQVWFVDYVPEPECFFKGEDPLHQAMQTPGLVWQRVQAASAWPALAELDPYRCNLRFQMVSDAPRDEIANHFRYVPEQVAIHPVALQHDLRACSWDSEALAIVQAQGEALWTPEGQPWVAGRMLGAVATIRACMQASGRTQGAEALEAACAEALRLGSGDPVLAWLDEFAHATGGQAMPAPGPAAQPQAQPAPPAVDDAQAGSPAARSSEGASTRILKVDQARVDRLMNLIGEMVVARNALPYLAARAEQQFGVRELGREIKTQHTVINRIVEEMQDAIMKIRMTPMSFVFQRFPRLVRDIARRLGKEVELRLEGAETEADRNVIEALADPLVHMVRNALDHGIEMPDVRRAAGKNPIGQLTIRARQEGDRVLIEIEDDGKGIDPDVIARKAYQRGLLDEAAYERIDRASALNLIFAAGFSTAEQVTDLSGRGVGMDAVRSAVESLGGVLQLDSNPGAGTCLRLSLPLSMAVSKVMVIESGGALYGVPMDLVVETVRIGPADIHSVGQRQAAVLRGRIVPLFPLAELLALGTPPRTSEAGELATLVLRLNGQEVGLVIDDFHDVMEVILKPLTGILGGVGVYAGSALMGDGTVMMVLNPKELLQ